MSVNQLSFKKKITDEKINVSCMQKPDIEDAQNAIFSPDGCLARTTQPGDSRILPKILGVANNMSGL